MSESAAVTPAASTEPAAPAANPVTPAVTPAAATVPEGVVLTKEQYDSLNRDAARARANQSKADRYDSLVGKGGGSGHFTPQAPVTPPSAEQMAEVAAAEDKKAEKGIMKLAADPAYREILDKDPTLRQMMVENPLAVLPLLANEALDAEHAIELIKEQLEKRKPAPAAPAPVTPPPTPNAGGVNPDSAVIDAEYEDARKGTGSTENVIANMVRIGLKRK